MSPPPEFFRAEVVDARALSPAMRRIVLGGEGLTGYESTGLADEWFRLAFSADGRAQTELVFTADGLVPAEEPVVRWYTVRRWDADRRELTVDVVIHDHGTATSWAARTRRGDAVVISAPTGRYRPDPLASWELIMADLTGLPAASRIIEQLPAGRPVQAILEVPSPDSVLEFDTAADLRVTWVYNPAPDATPSSLAEAARAVTLPPGRGYVWMAGEVSCSRTIRRYFRHELGWPSSAYDIIGYWRPDAEAYLRRYQSMQDQLVAIYAEAQFSGGDEEESMDVVLAAMEARGL